MSRLDDLASIVRERVVARKASGCDLLRFVAPIPPGTNARWRATRTGRIYVATETKAWMQGVREALAPIWGDVPTGDPVQVRILQAFHPEGRKKCPDVDASIKDVLDALTGVVVEDDRQVTSVTADSVIDPEGTDRVFVSVFIEPSVNTGMLTFLRMWEAEDAAIREERETEGEGSEKADNCVVLRGG